jgi:hypothetical protein
MAINTTKVENRRQLHFHTVGDILADVERLNQGKIKALGNWSSGQVLRHLTLVMNGSIDGFPFRLSWPLRLMGRLFRNRVLTKGMTPGYQLNGPAAEAFLPPATTWEEGLQAYRQAIHRQQTETKREPSPFFGAMTREQWEQLHCRHAELHLSFLVPETQ